MTLYRVHTTMTKTIKKRTTLDYYFYHQKFPVYLPSQYSNSFENEQILNKFLSFFSRFSGCFLFEISVQVYIMKMTSTF